MRHYYTDAEISEQERQRERRTRERFQAALERIARADEVAGSPTAKLRRAIAIARREIDE